MQAGQEIDGPQNPKNEPTISFSGIHFHFLLNLHCPIEGWGNSLTFSQDFNEISFSHYGPLTTDYGQIEFQLTYGHIILLKMPLDIIRAV